VVARVAAEALKSFSDPCADEVGYCDDLVAPVVTIDRSHTSTAPGEVVGLAQAVGLIDAVIDYALALRQAACTSVFDAGVRLKAFLCMNDAFVGATDLTGGWIIREREMPCYIPIIKSVHPIGMYHYYCHCYYCYYYYYYYYYYYFLPPCHAKSFYPLSYSSRSPSPFSSSLNCREESPQCSALWCP